MEEKELKILAIQMSSVIGDKMENFSKILELVSKNIKKNPDIIVLPEVWTLGWKPSIFKDYAEDINNSETIEFLSEIAQTYNVNVIGGSFISRQGSKLKNTCPVINRYGELIATYNKMHLFSYYGCDEGRYVESGQNPVLVDIDGVKIGLSICYDIRFPEIYRAYRKAGADLLVNMAAWPKKRAIHWESLTKARAVENQTFMLALTQSGLIENDEWNLGHSRLIDYDGNVISEVTKEDGVIFASISFDKMYEFRNKCTVLVDIHDKYDVK